MASKEAIDGRGDRPPGAYPVPWAGITEPSSLHVGIEGAAPKAPVELRSIVCSVELRETIRHPRAALKQRSRLQQARSSLAGMSATDEVQQQSLLPPSEELIQNRIIWVADAYGPTQVERLIAGLRATGLDKERGNARASDFVLRLRAGPSASGHTRLRTIVPQGATGYFDVTRAELPTGALLALPTITVIHGMNRPGKVGGSFY